MSFSRVLCLISKCLQDQASRLLVRSFLIFMLLDPIIFIFLQSSLLLFCFIRYFFLIEDYALGFLPKRLWEKLLKLLLNPKSSCLVRFSLRSLTIFPLSRSQIFPLQFFCFKFIASSLKNGLFNLLYLKRTFSILFFMFHLFRALIYCSHCCQHQITLEYLSISLVILSNCFPESYDHFSNLLAAEWVVAVLLKLFLIFMMVNALILILINLFYYPLLW